MEEQPKQRAAKKKLRVTFPNGDIICYSNAKATFVETLRRIDSDSLAKVSIELCHLPLLTRNPYPQYKNDMEDVGNGWFVNTRGGVYNKAAQLRIISDQFRIGLAIDVSADFKGEKVARGARGVTVLQVSFPDGTVIGEENTADTFMQSVWKIGIDRVAQLGLLHGGKKLITTAKQYNGQIQVDEHRWLLVPGATKDKAKLLKVINIMLHLNLDILFI
ncbi:MAG: hypothetical protein K6A82_05005 [Prevotella sp.]|nr:hypothetical protein [Prevotella sp.]